DGGVPNIRQEQMWRLIFRCRSGGSGIFLFRRKIAAGQKETSRQNSKCRFASRGNAHAPETRQFQLALSSLLSWRASWTKLSKGKSKPYICHQLSRTLRPDDEGRIEFAGVAGDVLG